MTNELAKTSAVIERETDLDLGPGVRISMGPGLFQTAGFLTRYIEDQEAQQISRMVYGIRRVKAAVYPVRDAQNIEDLNLIDLDRFERRGWKPALKVVDRDEIGWLLYRERRGRVHDLFVISVTDDELVLGRLRGNLDELLDFALIESERDEFRSFARDVENWFH